MFSGKKRKNEIGNPTFQLFLREIKYKQGELACEALVIHLNARHSLTHISLNICVAKTMETRKPQRI